MKYLYKRFFASKVKSLQTMEDNAGLEWFSLTSDYGHESSYGPIVHTYIVKEKLKLLDLGSLKIRNKIIKTLGESSIIDPDNMYSGGSGNKKAHNMLKKHFYDTYDGTIINEKTVQDDSLLGPTEVVLWKNYKKLKLV